MEDGLDVVAVGVVHEGAVVTLVVLRVLGRRLLLAGTGGQGGVEESVDRGPGIGVEANSLPDGAAKTPAIRLAISNTIGAPTKTTSTGLAGVAQTFYMLSLLSPITAIVRGDSC